MIRTFICIATLCSSARPAIAADDPLQPLGHWVGTWKTKTTSKGVGGNPKETTITGEETVKWVLNKKFIQGDAKDANGVLNHWLATYDAEKKVYRFWYFDSNGAFARGGSVGRWNAKTKTMSWTMDVGNGIRATGDEVLDKNTRKWSLIFRDREGKIVLNLSATLTRKK